MVKKFIYLVVAYIFCGWGFVLATPTTYIWTPSTDIQPYGKIHLNLDNYTPISSRDANGNRLYVQQVYGPTFSLLSDKPEDNILGKLWQPLDKLGLETGFDYKKGLGLALDRYPVYFHFKFAVGEDVYFKYMPAFAFGMYDIGYKKNRTNNNILYYRLAKTVILGNFLGNFNLGRYSAGYFRGNGKLLRDEKGLRDNSGILLSWDRALSEINERLWLCVDYQDSHSAYGAINYGLAWEITNSVSVIVAYDIYNNKNLKPTITFQLDVDF
ncbi:MAG: hypothetical protein NC923_06760 [Candidatus Omnitrophica bacterium]|nr:hypothetical protein [Candidatus Omnitrophota bacterium]